MWHAAARSPTGKIGPFNWTWGADCNIPEYEAWADEALYIDRVDPDERCSS